MILMDEQGEEFHLAMASLAKRFHGKRKRQILVDYC